MPLSKTISIVVNFYNMRREAERTLLSLTPAYQKDVSPAEYEVIAIDNGSTQPLDREVVQRFGVGNFKYVYYDTRSSSPSAAINQAVREAQTDLIMCLIDGARMFSPGVLKYSLAAAKISPHPFVYTLSMHLGSKPQNDSLTEGYDQQVEDRLLETVNWRENGYALFTISSVALSSKLGFFSELPETNCFTMRKDDFLRVGGLCEQFQSPGGGLVNLDFFNRVHECPEISPVMLLGEATFHQFHGGTATNVPMSRHPWKEFAEEYRRIRGREYTTPWRPPTFMGAIPPECRKLLCDSMRAWND